MNENKFLEVMVQKKTAVPPLVLRANSFSYLQLQFAAGDPLPPICLEFCPFLHIAPLDEH